jgi:di/tricarboxylate transporter
VIEAAAAKKNKIDSKYIIKALIGIAIMVFFRFIPPFDPITPSGMAVLGEFIGVIYLWTAVDMMWPTFVAIILFGFDAFTIYPNSWQLAGVYEAGMQSFGQWITVFVMCALILTFALEKCGAIRRLCLWFVTRSFAKKNPWTFTFMLLLSGLLISLFLDVTPAQFFMLAIVHEMFEVLGFKKGESWPRMIIIGVTFTAVLGFAMTPICHTLPILWMSIYSAMTGEVANMVGYMAVGIPVGLIIWVLMYFWFRGFVKPDMSKLINMDHAKIEAMRPGPMEKRERLTITISVIVLLLWLIPGFLGFLAPQSAFYGFMHNVTDSSSLMLGIVLLAIIRVDGEPLLDLREAFAKINWLPIVLLAGILLIASAMGEDPTGIPAWIAVNVVPLTAGMNPFMFIGVLSVLCIVLTNIANNVPVGIIFVVAGIPIAMQMGIPPVLVAIAISVSANLAYTIPPAYVPIAVAYADPWCKGSSVFKNGLVMALISCIVCFILIYPLGNLVF